MSLPQWARLSCPRIAKGLSIPAPRACPGAVLELRMRAHQEKHRSSKSPGVPLLEAGLNQCRFIVSEAHRPVLFCGRGTADGCSWCEHHRLIVYPPRAMQGGRAWRPPGPSATPSPATHIYEYGTKG